MTTKRAKLSAGQVLAGVAPRPTGTQALTERFPEARGLWSLSTNIRDGYVSPFIVTAFQINGRLVLLQEFGEDRGNSWDVFVQASDSGRIDDTLNAVAARIGLGAKTEGSAD